MTKNLNVAPYYDDFDEFKNYHQILFRPGTSVQARELTQVQSILKNQIAKFGNHVFQQGSIVIPGNSMAELSVPYITLNPTVDLSNVVGKIAYGVTSGVKAIVKASATLTLTEPDTLYLNYISGGIIADEPTGFNEFQIGESIQIQDSVGTVLKTFVMATKGLGSLVHINDGVYYVNGTFVSVSKQTIIISKYSNTPSCKVLLQISETFVTSDSDASLLDPAQGSYNFAAPGSDRLKISLTLTTLPYDSVITDDYVEIMRLNLGVIEEHARTPKYNELEKSLARRTYDESGDYVVSGLVGKAREHLKERGNGGLTASGSRSNFVLSVSSGKAYVGGFETEKLAQTDVVLPKARTAEHTKVKYIDMRPTFGRYILISDLTGNLSIRTKQSIDLWNVSSTTGGDKIGTARVQAIDYHIGAPNLHKTIYKLWVTDVVFDATFTMDDVGGIRASGITAIVCQILNAPLGSGSFTVTSDLVADNTVYVGASGSPTRKASIRYWDYIMGELYVHKSDSTKSTPRSGDLIVDTGTSVSTIVKNRLTYFSTGTPIAIFPIPVSNTKSLTNGSNVVDSSYTVWKELTLTTNSSGIGSVSTTGTLRAINVGTFLAFDSNGVVPSTLFDVLGSNTLSFDGQGNFLSTNITCFAIVDKDAVPAKTKTLTDLNELISSPARTVVTLPFTDIYTITSIKDSLNVDFLSHYVVNNGQTDYSYNRGTLTLKTNAPTPTGNITVIGKYFVHGGGDFFTVDSYKNNVGYEDFTLSYKSISSGTVFDLTNCVDARPSSNYGDSNFTNATSLIDILVGDELFSSSVQYYVPRYDLVTLNKNGVLSVIQGTPSETPKVPVTPVNALATEYFFVPAYTASVSDIRRYRLAVDRYTMKDIAALSNRITTLEEYSTLNAVESTVVNLEVLDAATGLSRYKTGYLVENFDTPFQIADANSNQFKATFDKGYLMPAMEKMDCVVTLNTGLSNHYMNTNGKLSLPYSEVVYAQQPLSSRVTNINPFLIIKWNGILTCTPNNDYWVDMIDLPSIFNEVTETVVVNRWVTPPDTTNFGGSNGSFNQGFTDQQAVMDGITGLIGLNDGWGTLGTTQDALSGLIGLNDGFGTMGSTNDGNAPSGETNNSAGGLSGLGNTFG